MPWLSVKSQQPFQGCHVFWKGTTHDVTITHDVIRGDPQEYIPMQKFDTLYCHKMFVMEKIMI